MNTGNPTCWTTVIVAFGAGVVGAAHIGKVPAALPAMRAEFAMDLVTAGWVVSLFSMTGILLGMAVGLLSDRLGHRALAVGGMVLLAAGSVASSSAESVAVILVTRFVEGLGYIIAIVSAPSIIAEAAAPADRRLAVGMWGAFMPTGMGVMLLISPFTQEWVGWRGSWLALAVMTLIWAMVMALVFRGGRGKDYIGRPEHPWRNLSITAAARGPWLLALCFGFYTLAWIALMVWLPTFMVEQRGMAVRTSALVTVIVVFINLPGNLLGGWLSHKAVPRGAVIAIVGVLITFSGPLMFLEILPDGARFAVCLVYSFMVGMLPATILGAAPYFTPGIGQIATTNGLIVQGSHLGQFAGPPVVASAVAFTGGWQAGALVFACCGLGVLLFAALIAREERHLSAIQGSSDSNTP